MFFLEINALKKFPFNLQPGLKSKEATSGTWNRLANNDQNYYDERKRNNKTKFVIIK